MSTVPTTAAANHPAIVSNGLCKWFGEGSARMVAVDQVASLTDKSAYNLHHKFVTPKG